MTNSTLEAYILLCPTEERLRLAAWRTSSNGMRVKYGALVRTKLEELWDDEEMQRIIAVPYVYGIISHEEEYHPPSTLSAWAVNWATDHLPIPENTMTFSLCCGLDKTKLELVTYRRDDFPSNIDYPLAKYFEKNQRGDWSIKEYVLECEFCAGTECNRMDQKEDLDDMVRDLRCDEELDNKSKRYKMYRTWIRFKYGRLGPGERREVHECVRKLIVTTFPPPPGIELTGYSKTRYSGDAS